MLFNSIEFIAFFLPFCLAGYFFLGKRGGADMGKWFLVILSAVFYTWVSVKLAWVLALSAAVNYALGSWAHRREHYPKALLVLGLIFNLLLLGFFKYTNFFIDTLNTVLIMHIRHLDLLVPLGISFWTFQQISYQVDDYRGHVQNRSPVNYLLYILFFPKVICGPITRYRDLITQFDAKTAFTANYKTILTGLYLFTIGLAKKVILAAPFAAFADQGYAHFEQLSILETWVVLISFSLQIYFDFSGYTDMALGVAKMFNIKLPDNFHMPYFAASVQDFWRRWHITLSSFLRDYLYFPLGGSRRSMERTAINVLIVFLVCGIWHGAMWLFVLWGLVHGVGVCFNRFWKKTNLHFSHRVSMLFTFIYVTLAWVFFRAESLQQALHLLWSSGNVLSLSIPKISHLDIYFGNGDYRYTGFMLYIVLAGLMLFVGDKYKQYLINPNAARLIKAAVFTLLLWFCVYQATSQTISEFLYFQF